MDDQRNRSRLPLCVDLDGTLTHTDLMWESLVRLVKKAPVLLFLVPGWLLKGKAHVKSQLAERTRIDATVLPYNENIVRAVTDAREAGRETLLISGSDRKHVQRVFEHLGIFERYEASDGRVNLTGKRKAERLAELFGDGAYEYVANGSVDMAIWRRAGAAGMANVSAKVLKRVQALGIPLVNHGSQRPRLRDWIRAMRIHQWAKNALLLVPLITAHRVLDPGAVLQAAVAFFSFGLCASATYMLNDLMDLDADRHHKTKRMRPFAAGRISIPGGILGGTVIFAAGIGASFALPWEFRLALCAYIVLTVLYSMWFKRIASLDVITLACLYTLRIIAGAFAISVPLSFWLLAFSMFIFLCLAMVKRVTELLGHTAQDGEHSNARMLRGREYAAEDIPILTAMGATSGYLAVLVLAFYINSEEVSLLYRTPQVLWLIAPLILLWVTRLWIVTTRGYMDDDPVAFAIRDPETWVTAGTTIGILLLATLVAF